MSLSTMLAGFQTQFCLISNEVIMGAADLMLAACLFPWEIKQYSYGLVPVGKLE